MGLLGGGGKGMLGLGVARRPRGLPLLRRRGTELEEEKKSDGLDELVGEPGYEGPEKVRGGGRLLPWPLARLSCVRAHLDGLQRGGRFAFAIVGPMVEGEVEEREGVGGGRPMGGEGENRVGRGAGEGRARTR